MITAIILTKNEEKNIKKAIESVRFSDEVIVIDDNSTDRTQELAKKYGATVIVHPLHHDFAAQRNYALKCAAGDWVLYIDADEEVNPELRQEIKEVCVAGSEAAAYSLRRRDFFWGHEMRFGETAKVRTHGLIRLMKKDTGKWKGKVHEEFISRGQTGQLQGFLDHYPHQTVREFIEDVNYYSSVRADELASQGHSVSIGEAVFNPLLKFIYTYFIKMGFRDGPAGFAYSFFMSFHSFLVRAKLYQRRFY